MNKGNAANPTPAEAYVAYGEGWDKAIDQATDSIKRVLGGGE